NSADGAIGHHLDSRWRGPYTVVQVKSSAIVLLPPEVLIPPAEQRLDQIIEVDNIPFDEEQLLYVSLKNVVHAAGFEQLVREEARRGTRVYVDSAGRVRTAALLDDPIADLDNIWEERAKQAIAEGLVKERTRRAGSSVEEDSRPTGVPPGGPRNAQSPPSEGTHDGEEKEDSAETLEEL
ncbi:hypothetical protein FOZ63_023648, partial [Perkinsus olseni]